jgi:hypothetical protein
MNIHKEQKKIASLLHNGWREHYGQQTGLTRTYNSGIYLISQKQNSSLNKLGTAFGQGGLYRRIMDYKVCYSLKDEFWLNYMIICPEIKINKETFSQKLEKILLKNIGTQADKSYSKEWLINSNRKTLEMFLFNTLNNNRPLWTHILKFTPNGWIVIENTEQFSFHKNPTWDTKIINGKITKSNRKNYKTITKSEYNGLGVMLNQFEEPKKIAVSESKRIKKKKKFLYLYNMKRKPKNE